MRVVIHEDYKDMSRWATKYIADKINNAKPTAKKPFIMGLPTGSSPLGTYRELIKLNKSKKVSFKNVITFNMDEYVGIAETHTESYHYFMWHNFFRHIDIPKKNVNILNGNAKDLEKECIEYEKKIVKCGGIDFFLGGIGPDGHIAFNEPGSSLTSRTRVKSLCLDTIIANSRFFDNDISKVPSLALTVGVGTVMDSKEVMLVINGHNKARALRKLVNESISHMWTASMLQMHPKAILACDEEATGELPVDIVKYFKDIERVAIKDLP